MARSEPPRTSASAQIARTVIGSLRNVDPERALVLGAGLGRSWVRARGPRVDVARTNLRLCFPERDEAWHRATLLASFENLGRSLAEVAQLHGRHRAGLLERVKIEGIEHLDAALREGEQREHGGAFVLTAHFGSWELGGAVLAGRGYPMTSVHRARNDERLDAIVASWRRDSGQDVVALGEAGLGALRALRRNRLVMMLIDQNARPEEGIFAPFFGVDASTRLGPARLAARLGIPVVPAFIHRVGASGDHVGRVHPPLVLEPEPDDPEAASEVLRANVSAMNRAVEEAVRSDPAQWMWAHRRFRTRPPEAERRYPVHRGAWRRVRRALRGRR